MTWKAQETDLSKEEKLALEKHDRNLAKHSSEINALTETIKDLEAKKSSIKSYLEEQTVKERHKVENLLLDAQYKMNAANEEMSQTLRERAALNRDIDDHKALVQAYNQEVENKANNLSAQSEKLILDNQELEQRRIALTEREKSVVEDNRKIEDKKADVEALLESIKTIKQEHALKEKELTAIKKELTQFEFELKMRESKVFKKEEGIKKQIFELKSLQIENERKSIELRNQNNQIQNELAKLNDLKTNVEVLLKQKEGA